MTKLTDPRALRALAHPIRLALVGMLRQEGPLTATRAAALLGESSASTSFHLRQLAKYGLVEEAGGGRGRERPWRATAMFTQWPDVAEGAEQQAATALLSSVIAERYFEDLMRWPSAKPEESPEWQEAAHFGDTFVYATAAELRELARQEVALLEPFLSGSSGDPVHRHPRAARRRGRDGLPDRRHLVAQPDLRPARGRVGGPVRPPPDPDDHGRSRPRGAAVAFAVGTLSVLFTVCDPALFVALVPVGVLRRRRRDDPGHQHWIHLRRRHPG